jgi:hypothetical protein
MAQERTFDKGLESQLASAPGYTPLCNGNSPSSGLDHQQHAIKKDIMCDHTTIFNLIIIDDSAILGMTPVSCSKRAKSHKGDVGAKYANQAKYAKNKMNNQHSE